MYKDDRKDGLGAWKLGAQVYVVRTRHGWYDGQLEARVHSRWQRDTGTFHYTVLDAEGNMHDVSHTRDLR